MTTEQQILSELAALHQKLLFIHKDVLTIDEASVFTGLATGTLKEYVFKKKIGAWKPGVGHSAKLYFEKADLLSYMRQNRVKSNEEISTEAATYSFKRKSA